MRKNKAEPSKPRSATKKRLRLVDNSPIGLTDDQQRELVALYRPLSLNTCSDVKDRAGQKQLTLNRYLHIYIEALCHDVRLENANRRKGHTTSVRRQVVTQLGKLIGRDWSPDDIIKALTKHAPVPSYAANAIRRDYLRCTV